MDVKSVSLKSVRSNPVGFRQFYSKVLWSIERIQAILAVNLCRIRADTSYRQLPRPIFKYREPCLKLREWIAITFSTITLRNRSVGSHEDIEITFVILFILYSKTHYCFYECPYKSVRVLLFYKGERGEAGRERIFPPLIFIVVINEYFYTDRNLINELQNLFITFILLLYVKSSK